MTTPLEVRINSLLATLAAALCAELTVAEEDSDVPKPTLCTVLPGSAVAFDYCDEGGMAYTRLVGIIPINANPGKCATEFEVGVEIAILRCAPVVTEGGELPDDAEQLAASMLQNFDMGLMHKVISCTEVPQVFDFLTLGTFTPIGPDGGCLGGSWTATWRTA